MILAPSVSRQSWVAGAGTPMICATSSGITRWKRWPMMMQCLLCFSKRTCFCRPNALSTKGLDGRSRPHEGGARAT